ncbi:MAG TPA: VOC family protein [Vicinamibacterales bacterium]|jgi:PhnB protein
MAEALIARLDRTIDVMLAGGDATAALTDAELAPLARLAGDLRSCPSAAFKARLRAKLERMKTMSVVLEDLKIREGFTTVTPYLHATKPGLLDFLTRAFGAVETETTTTPRGVHREVRVGNSMVMIGEGGPEDAVHPPASFHVFVPDVDAAYERAIAAGATSLGAPEDRHYGERSGFVKDAFGNHWYIATSLGPTPVPGGLRTVTPYLHPRGVPSYIDFLTRAFSAVEEFRAESNGVVMHAQVRIGNAIVEMGEGSDATTRQAVFYLYVADCDALYAQAVAAGAKPLAPPADMFYGDRVGSVEDAMGITWYLARPA